MRMISEGVLAAIIARFPAGTRVELIHMDDPYNRKLVPGCKGTVLCVDDMGTIHVSWTSVQASAMCMARTVAESLARMKKYPKRVRNKP